MPHSLHVREAEGRIRSVLACPVPLAPGDGGDGETEREYHGTPFLLFRLKLSKSRKPAPLSLVSLQPTSVGLQQDAAASSVRGHCTDGRHGFELLRWLEGTLLAFGGRRAGKLAG